MALAGMQGVWWHGNEYHGNEHHGKVNTQVGGRRAQGSAAALDLWLPSRSMPKMSPSGSPPHDAPSHGTPSAARVPPQARRRTSSRVYHRLPRADAIRPAHRAPARPQLPPSRMPSRRRPQSHSFWWSSMRNVASCAPPLCSAEASRFPPPRSSSASLRSASPLRRLSRRGPSVSSTHELLSRSSSSWKRDRPRPPRRSRISTSLVASSSRPRWSLPW
mmetsp:Transcript_986/g.3097  ORF Transcript_986/g.3097 Transcript_986/m.3097 type:complete len:218 (-) Transcript_986:542-1195(-)